MFCNQILPELPIICAHAVKIFRQFDGGGYRGRNVGRKADGLFNFFRKLRRIRRFENHGGQAAERFGGQPVLKAAPRDRAVRFEQQSVFVPDFADCLCQRVTLVGDGTGKQIASHRGEVGLLMNPAGLVHAPAINRHEPREIARMPDVHRVGN